MSRILRSLLFLGLLGVPGAPAAAQLCPIMNEGGPQPPPPPPAPVPASALVGGRLGSALVCLGDLRGDGTTDFLVGVPFAGASGEGTLRLMSFHGPSNASPGTLASSIDLSASLSSVLEPGGALGASLALLGDIDGDGRVELAVGAPGEENGRGAVYLFTLREETLRLALLARIASGAGGFVGTLSAGDGFGAALAEIGDLNGDGRRDLGVGAPGTDEGGVDRGAVWVLFLDDDGLVMSSASIHAATTGLPPGLDVRGAFGSSIHKLGRLSESGDLDGDGVPDLSVGAPEAFGTGTAWILFMSSSGGVQSVQSLTGPAGINAALEAGDRLGAAACALGPPVDGACEQVLAIGAPGSRDWAAAQGAVYYLCLDAGGGVTEELRVSAGQGGFAGFLRAGDEFGSALTQAGDVDGNQLDDLMIGSPGDDGFGPQAGNVWLVYHAFDHVPRAISYECLDNPADLSLSSGAPLLATELVFEMESTAAHGSTGVALLLMGPAPEPTAPCGTVLAGYQGELLVQLAGSSMLIGPAWEGTQGSVELRLSIPNMSALIGVSIFVQGCIQTSGIGYLSNAHRLVIAD